MDGTPPTLPIKAARADVTVPEVPVAPAAPVRFTFRDLCREVSFFTHALLQVRGGFDRDVIKEFTRYYPADPHLWPQAIDSATPFFQGLGVHDGVDFDHRLFYIHNSRWEAFRDFVAGIGYSIPATQTFVRIRFSILPLLDLAAMQRGGVFEKPPVFPVTVFVVTSDQDLFTIEHPGKLLSTPRVVRKDPLPEISVEARRLFAAEFSEEEMHAVQKDIGHVPPEVPE